MENLVRPATPNTVLYDSDNNGAENKGPKISNTIIRESERKPGLILFTIQGIRKWGVQEKRNNFHSFEYFLFKLHMHIGYSLMNNISKFH